MAENPGTFETKGTPTIYCNLATAALSYSDIRIYLLEQSPSELLLNPTGNQLVEKPPLNESKCCLVLSPEFAASLAKVLTDTITQYERVFGSLRPQPTQAGVAAALASHRPPQP
jgi:hypothetical protein